MGHRVLCIKSDSLSSASEKTQEEPPAKLLDDLFRKTKAAPCIYWLPLTDSQVSAGLPARPSQELQQGWGVGHGESPRGQPRTVQKKTRHQRKRLF